MPDDVEILTVTWGDVPSPFLSSRTAAFFESCGSCPCRRWKGFELSTSTRSRCPRCRIWRIPAQVAELLGPFGPAADRYVAALRHRRVDGVFVTWRDRYAIHVEASMA